MAVMDTMDMWVNQKLQRVRVIIFDSKEEADETLRKMDLLLYKNGFVSVADIRDMLDIPQSESDPRWGWIDIKTTVIFKIHKGWVLTWMGDLIPIHAKQNRRQQ